MIVRRLQAMAEMRRRSFVEAAVRRLWATTWTWGRHFLSGRSLGVGGWTVESRSMSSDRT